MFMVGPVGFTAPLLLWALVALPVLWLLLRAVPPAPIRRRFPGVALLLGLKDEDNETDRTPWWLLLLRMLAVAAVIAGFAGPVLNPVQREAGTGPLLIVMDGGWADARDWPRRVERAVALADEAGRDGRTVAVVRLTDRPEAPVFQTAEAWAGRLAALAPEPWLPVDLAGWAAVLDGSFDTYWLSDGLAHEGQDALFAALEAAGQVTVFQSPRPVLALHPAVFADGAVQVAASRVPAADALSVEVVARGPDPAGIERDLARAVLDFGAGAARAEVALALPPELRNRITRFELAGIRSAGAVSLTDDSLKRRKVALIGGDVEEGLQLLSPTHYLRQALEPVAELIDGSLMDVLPANPDVVVLADVAALTQEEQDAVLGWLDGGGLLLRFAGPSLAASDVSRLSEDPLMPVRLREGGRTVGGAMSWGEPKTLAPFPEGSPFHGLAVPEEVQVTSQVLAQPDPDLAERTIAALEDGTPLVTRKEVGQGQVVLVHVTANAEWSNLPLSGLFVQILERLAVSTRSGRPEAGDLEGQTWVPEVLLDAYGVEADAGEVAGVDGAGLAAALATGPGPAMRPGLYAGAERRVALNAVSAEAEFAPAVWPAGTVVEGIEAVPERALKGWFLTAALVALMVDVLAALWISGRLSGLRRAAASVVVVAALALGAGEVRAQDEVPLDPQEEALALEATTAVVLGHVLTGDAQVDEVAEAGLRGLGERLWERTSIEPEAPVGVDIERDELAFFPFLYWPVTADQKLPSAAAYRKLNDFLRTGGMILFDTRDADMARTGATTPESQQLQRIAAGLSIPALEPVPQDHVLTRTFYLLQDFPGRYQNAPVWVEAAPPDAEQVEGMPFRNLNDGVTPVVIGGNDWAAAWAVDDMGVPVFPVGRGFAGERQREMANRFGINLIMHVLTGNYKSDQVHVPALLERLGQ
ncbi:MAG: LytTR family transcriptional regulator [Rhodobacter sp. CACIA14H1]|nr:MAG: LytTR family transcriptional regulator [Rhodobacter sp. CACIA14H1]